MGPSLLVLGEEARENGLKYSLLQRLQVLYKKCGDKASKHMVSLNTNYRCHKDIVNIFNELFFYTSRIKMRPYNASERSQTKYPLVFVCSSLTSKVDYELAKREAQLLLQQVGERWDGTDPRTICLTTATRTQVCIFL